MNKFTLDSIINEAKKLGSYFITITTKDKSKKEGDLTHYTFREEFSIDDVNPSLDQCVRSLGVRLEKPADVIKPEVLREARKPLKIAILSHFHKMPDSFSPARATKNQIKILQEYGHSVTLFAQEDSVLDIGCEVRPVLPRFKMEKNIVNEEAKNRMVDILREQLVDFDICITQDFYIDSLITYREAVRSCGINIPFFHFCRSGIGAPIEFDMPNATYVYLNYSDVGEFARKIGVSVDRCRVVPNEKELLFMFSFHPISKMIIEKYHLWDRDIIQIFPVCSTRLDAKGLIQVIKVFVELKRLGKKVALVVANSNGRKRVEDLKVKQELAKELGLNDNEFIFTSLLADEQYDISSEIPNRSCAELMQISNLFIFPTIAEVSSNVLLEAAMTKNLLVLNSDLPCLFDAVDKNSVISYPFTSSRALHYSGRDQESMGKLAKQIIGQLDTNKADKTFRHVWRNYNRYSLYHNILAPILYERKS